MKFFSKLIIFLIIIAVIIVGGASFFLPGFVSSQIEAQLNEQLHPESQSVRIESSPGIKLAMGDIDSFRGTLNNIKLGKLNVSEFTFDMSHMQVSPTALLLNRQVQITNMGTGEIGGVITQNDLKNYLEAEMSSDKLRGLSLTDVNITSNGVELTGNLNIGGLLQGEADIAGMLELKDNVLYFTPQRFELNGMSIRGLNASVLTKIKIYDFANFPIPVKVDRIETVNGEIHMYVNPIAK